MKPNLTSIHHSPLGKHSEYKSHYQPDLLFPITRALQRENLGITHSIPFYGVDVWNAYELSWLNPKGKPMVAIAEFHIPCTSPCLIESKSFKLYLNSFNHTKYTSMDEVSQTIARDLSLATGSDVFVKITALHEASKKIVTQFNGLTLDHLDIECDTYQVNSHFLTTENSIVSEVLHSDLLKSNCLITGQPDWGSLQISYTGNKINHENLLKYIISFRNHHEFHEHCVERIFMDILHHCKPTTLSVHAHYVRRGGLDINPYRSTELSIPNSFLRLSRQ